MINKKFSARFTQRKAVYIGRPSKWSNPYNVPRESYRKEAIEAHKRLVATRLINGELTEEDFKEFEGKHLMCFCAPKACHGDILLKLFKMTHEERLNWAYDEASSIHR